MPGLDIFIDDVSGLQHDPHSNVHFVRFQDSQNTGEFQRGQVHRLHHVLDLHRLAGIRAYLFRHKQRLQGHYSTIKKKNFFFFPFTLF